jgi:uncharacterized membrane protein YjgN (DUF898 family)
MTKRNAFTWQAIQVICWLIFAGLCVQSGALIFNFIYSLFKPIATHNLHLGLDLSTLYTQSKTLYVVLFSLAILVSTVKAVVFYFVLRLFKNLTLSKPFTENIANTIATITFYAFGVGLISYLSHQFTQKLTAKAYDVSIIERYWNDGGAYLMMSAILFVITLLFKKGIELQNENDLTV